MNRANEKNSSDLLILYRQVLESAGAVVDAQGFVSRKEFGKKETMPLLIDGQRLVLHTPEQLKNVHAGKTVVFHPMWEQAIHGESKVTAYLRKMMTTKLTVTLAATMNSLLRLAASTAEHKKLSPDQSEFLSVVGEVNEDTQKTFDKWVVSLATKNVTTALVALHLRRGGVINKQPYNRTAIVTFAAYNELLANTDPKVPTAGVKFKVKERTAILNLFRYVLPMIDTPNAYSAGSNSVVAPFTDALMKSYGQMASQLNDIVTLFKKQIDGADDLLIPMEWGDAFENLSIWQNAVHMVPPQAGNEGSARNPNAPRPSTMQSTQAVESHNGAVEVVAVDPQAVVTPVVAPAEAPAPFAPPPGAGYFASLPPLPQGQVHQVATVAYAPHQIYQPQPMSTEPMVTEGGVNFRAALAASGLAGVAAHNTQLPPELQYRQMQQSTPAGHVPYQQQTYMPQMQQPRAGYSTGGQPVHGQPMYQQPGPGFNTSF